MAQRFDSRDFGYRRSGATPETFAASARAAKLIAPHSVVPGRINPFTGSVSLLNSTNAPVVAGFAPNLPASDGALVDAAIAHLDSVADALGFAPDAPVEFIPDPVVKTTSSGMRVVNAKQYYHGVPVFQMERTVTFDRAGALTVVMGSSVSLPPDLEVLPSVPVELAATLAAEKVATATYERDPWAKTDTRGPSVDVSAYVPVRLGGFDFPSQPVLLTQGPFAEAVPAHLVLFYQGDRTRLGWHFIITLPDFVAQYVVIVAADSAAKRLDGQRLRDEDLLYLVPTHANELAFVGNVFPFNPAHSARQQVSFPRPLSDYPVSATAASLPNGFPPAWCTSVSPHLTVGNSTIAVRGNTSTSLAGQLTGSTVTFNPPQDQGDDQKVLNIFYFCNYMHDFFYLLGFTEAAGNFQEDNFGLAGVGGDPVVAHAHPGPVNGTANMLTRADGTRGVMNMGLVSGTGRHTAFDSDVVFHEFTHGVTNRLVGGMRDARALQLPQSVGMGEGWSDYFALTIQNYSLATERTVTGDWVINNPNGIRLHPYDQDYPAGFGSIGKPPYDSDEHAIGEVWCAALMQLNRNLIEALGSKDRGHNLGWQIVVDGLKLTPSNPSFLDARDAILQALDAKGSAGDLSGVEYKACRRAAWKAFSRFELGPRATTVGASLDECVGDKSLPTGI